MSVLQGGEIRLPRVTHFDPRSGFEFGDPGVDGLGRIEGHPFVRPPGREDADLKPRIGVAPFVVFKRISRVIRRAERNHPRVEQQRASGNRPQSFTRLIPDASGSGRRQQRIDPEIPFQFKSAPVEHRVAKAERDRGRKRLEPLVITRRSRNPLLGHAIGAHHPPFIVVTRQPELGQVRPAPVLRNLLRRQMIVEIQDRLRRRMPVIQFDRRR